MDNYRKFRISFILFVFCMFLQGFTNLSATEKVYNTKPYDFVASEILQNKIVMLGENGAIDHYNLFPHMTFLNVIKSWTDKVKEAKLQGKTLTLVLEKSPSAVKLLKQYIYNGDLMPFVNKHGDVYSLEDLYLYNKLRDLNREIKESHNTLKIVGFEIDERYEDDWFFKQSEEAIVNFIGNQRDSLLYENISSYIKANPKEEILIYYGGAHLNNEKYRGPFPIDKYGEGDCLGVYLKRKYGEKFVTVDQTFIPDEEFKYTDDIAYLKDKIFLAEKDDPLFMGKVPYTNLQADYTILRHDGLVAPHFIRNVFSRNTLLMDYGKLTEFKDLSEKYNRAFSLKLSEVKNPLVRLTLESIELITGREFNSVEDYKSYLDSTANSFYHDRIVTEEFSDQLLSCLKKDSQDNNFRFTLFCFGFTPSFYLYTQGVPPEEVWKGDLWKKACPHMNYFDNVGLYWLGNTVEKERAKKFLTDFTKQDYAEASEYLEWYYKNIYNYHFDI